MALRPTTILKTLPPKQAVAQLTTLGVEGARALCTLPSGQVKVVFTTLKATKATRATPTWVKALDLEASFYLKIFSLWV